MCTSAATQRLKSVPTVEFEIALPPELTGGKENVIVQCRGRVVRKDAEGG